MTRTKTWRNGTLALCKSVKRLKDSPHSLPSLRSFSSFHGNPPSLPALQITVVELSRFRLTLLFRFSRFPPPPFSSIFFHFLELTLGANEIRFDRNEIRSPAWMKIIRQTVSQAFVHNSSWNIYICTMRLVIEWEGRNTSVINRPTMHGVQSCIRSGEKCRLRLKVSQGKLDAIGIEKRRQQVSGSVTAPAITAKWFSIGCYYYKTATRFERYFVVLIKR